MSSDADAPPRPWQFDWKRPKWQSPSSPTDNNNTINKQAKPSAKGKVQGKGLLIDHTAAAVLPSEVVSLLDPQTDEASSLGSLVLTVTLLATTSTTTARSAGSTSTSPTATADVVLVELTRQSAAGTDDTSWLKLNDTDTSASDAAELECLHSRSLRWPESALKGLSSTDTDESLSASEHNPFLQFPFFPWRQNTQQQQSSSCVVGLVSVSLCRLPPATPTITVMQDALDVVHLLSLGMTTGLSVSQTEWLHYLQQQQQPNSSSNSVDDADDATGSGSRSTDLVLACLTSDGHVHLYSPWDLLGMDVRNGATGTSATATSTAATKQQPQPHNDDDHVNIHNNDPASVNVDFLDHAMASFMLGDGLLTSIQESILPLSQPTHSIALSVPWHRAQQKETETETEIGSNQKKKRGKAKVQDNDQEEEEQDTAPSLSSLASVLWDPSAWDPTMDAATGQYRTTDNVPVTSVAAWDYLCVAGRGRQIRNRHGRLGKKRASSASVATAWTPPHTPQSVASRKVSPLSPPRVAVTGDSQQQEQQHAGDQQRWVEDSSLGGGGDNVKAPSVQASAASTFHLPDQQGGFVTFISLRNYSEARTIYLPFAPTTISPFLWGGMSFLLVVGDTVAVAIRTDASDVSSVVDGKAPSSIFASTDDYENNETEVSGQGVPGSKTKQTMIHIRRFQILPIRFPESFDHFHTIIVGSAMSTSPPGLASLFSNERETQVVQHALHGVNLLSSDEAVPLFANYRPNMDQDSLAVISTEYGQTAQMPTSPQDEQLLHCGSTWCHLGQGWCLLGTANIVYFICWEGAMTGRGPFVFELAEEMHECIQGLVSVVLPINPFARGTSMAYQDVKLPFTEPFDKPAVFRQLNEAKESDVSDSSDDLDDIVVVALESISTLNYRETVGKELSPRRKSSYLTNQEKSVRLLRQCSSWTQLEQSNQTRSHFELQEPAVSVRLGVDSSEHFLLSLRRIVLENGEATPFQQVLSWLSDQQDYFTAASLALDLLRDGDSLRHLWRAFEKIDEDDARSKLEGLLDGIIPIYGEGDKAPLQSTLTQLADMTVGCLTKGGYAMSSTLEQFVKRNPSYDPARACLMLVAATACAVSDDENTISSVMGKDYKKNDNHNSNIMWPVRCLLQVGVARGNLFTALLLLNVTIPDELRQRRRSGAPSASVPSMEMCNSLVSLIVASSPDAADLLLGLVDEQSRQPFWQSLQHDARLELSLISIGGKNPMLRQPEVRLWALKQLHKCMEAEGSASSVNVFETMPTNWLKALSMACLTNAGCSLDAIFRSTFGESLEETPDSDGLIQHVDELKAVRNALVPAPGSGGLDFDLLIPALLILESRNVLWCEGSNASTQSMLNAACYLAGRRNIEEPLFVLDSATLMLQCTLCGNVPAGAKFVGGKNGLILECCDILMQQVGMQIEEAEAFLLSDPMLTNFNATTTKEPVDKSFAVDYAHRHILWMLEEHVLRIRTYGDFDTTHMRGKVDAIFAATLCLRTWWCVTRQNLDAATAWLVRWLRQQLGVDESDLSKISPHRLVCAALVRALVWPSNSKSNNNNNTSSVPVLATMLHVPSHFLIQLAQSCCGLVEAVPATVAEEAWKMMQSSNANTNTSNNAIVISSISSVTMDAVMNLPAESTPGSPARLQRDDSDDSVISTLSN